MQLTWRLSNLLDIVKGAVSNIEKSFNVFYIFSYYVYSRHAQIFNKRIKIRGLFFTVLMKAQNILYSTSNTYTADHKY